MNKIKRGLGIFLAVALLITLGGSSLADVMTVGSAGAEVFSEPNGASTGETLPADTTVTIIASTVEGWTGVLHKGTAGFVRSGDLTAVSSGSTSSGGTSSGGTSSGGSTSSGSTSSGGTSSGGSGASTGSTATTVDSINWDGTPVKTLYVKTNNLNLRAGDSKSSASLGQYLSDTEVKVYKELGGWNAVEIARDGKRGFMQTQHLTDVKPTEKTQSVPGNYTEEDLIKVMYVNSDGLNLRAGESKNTESLGKYPVGTEVEVYKEGDAWNEVIIKSEVKEGRKQGYMQAQHLTDTPPEGGSSGGGNTYTTPVKTMYVNIGDLNLREGQGRDTASLGQYQIGTEVDVYSEGGSWLAVEVKQDGKRGYMQAQHLTDTKPVVETKPDPETPVKTMYVTIDDLNLREAATKLSTSLGKYRIGDEVDVYIADGEWYRVEAKADGTRGYMQAQYLSDEKPVIEPPAPLPETPIKTMYVNIEDLNLRERDSIDSQSLAQYQVGEAVDVYVDGGEWLRVKVKSDGKEGYMQAQYLTDTAPGQQDAPPAPGKTMYVNIENLNLRTQESAISDVVSQYQVGEAVEVLAEGAEWHRVKVKSDGNEGYMLAEYLTATKPEGQETPPTPGKTMYVNVEKLDLREEEKADAQSLGEYALGEPVEMLSEGAEWRRVKVKADGKEGFMPVASLTDVKPEAREQIDDAAKPNQIVYVNAPNLDLRDEAKTGGKSLGQYPIGEEVEVLTVGIDWHRVKVKSDGKEGYMPVASLSETLPEKAANEAAATTMYIGVNNVTLRASESAAAQSLGTYNAGTEVKVFAQGSEWSDVKIVEDNKEGFVQAAVLVAAVNDAAIYVPVYKYVNVGETETLKMYSTPSDDLTTSQVLGYYRRGTRVEFLGLETDTSWSRVRIGNLIGYMRSSELSTIDPTVPQKDDIMYVQIAYGQTLDLRAERNYTSEVFATYPAGTKVQIISWDGEWANVYVVDDGYREGFMLTRYLSSTVTPPQPEYEYATVNNPNPLDRLNLRVYPSTYSASVGQYYNGTIVRVLEYGPVWCHVEIGTLTGYMMTAYLSFTTDPTPTPPVDVTYATVNNPNARDRLNLRAQPTTASASLGLFYNGTRVTVYEYGAVWCRVEVNGLYGYMMTRYLLFGGSGGGETPSYSYATVNNPVATQRLNLRALPTRNSASRGQYYNGTSVRIISYGSEWCHVEVNNRVGYMMTAYLSFSGGGSGGGGITGLYAVVKNPVATHRLNLRALPSKSSRSLAQYYNGTVVNVLEYGVEWCRVEVNGLRGYMMTYYLSFPYGTY